MNIYEYQAKKLYVKKEDLEQALGIKLPDIKARFFETKKELPDYLKPYSLMPTFTLGESVALLIDVDPSDYNEQNQYHYLYGSTENLLTREIDSGALNNYGGISKKEIKISHSELEKWAKARGYKWNLPIYSENIKANNELLQNTTSQNQITELQEQNAELLKRIAELEQELQNQNQKQAQAENKAQRISQPQRDIFTLLTVKNYPDCNSRNELFSVINADLKANGITTKDIQYSTLDRLIDENIRIGSPIRSPFPPKQN